MQQPVDGSSAWWRLKLDDKEIEIEKGCHETIPCQHTTKGPIASISCGIWLELKQHPELKESHPDLWSHFEEIEQCCERRNNHTISIAKQIPEFGGPPRLCRVGRIRMVTASTTVTPTKPVAKRDKSPKGKRSTKVP